MWGPGATIATSPHPHLASQLLTALLALTPGPLTAPLATDCACPTLRVGPSSHRTLALCRIPVQCTERILCAIQSPASLP